MFVRHPFTRVVRALVFLGASHIAAAGLAAQTPDHGQHRHPAAPGSSNGAEVSLAREGSGTSWLPDASPMFAVHERYGEWDLMGHGSLFVQYLADGGDRGHDQFGSINWAMGMARRNLETGRLTLRGMMSLEPWTVSGCGYPDLLASGEVCDGQSIVDRQHPHDLFMEIAAAYDRELSPSLGLQLYGGLVGEPALGPVAFPHRVSAAPNPIAPLSHHWLDSTHIAYGVLTGGVYGRTWKAEGSIFNGREPDETRYDFDFGALDSFSGRVWYLPNEHLAFQVSAGHLGEAEADPDGGPRVDVGRVTAAATYHVPFRDGSSIWASTFGWGRNSEEGTATNFVLAETNVTYDDQDAWYGRLEIGRKTAHDLDVPVPEGGDDLFTVAKAQAGYTRYFAPWHGLAPGVGGTLSMSLVPARLDTVYGNRATFGIGLYVTLRPASMNMR